jgi:hypothetical protein
MTRSGLINPALPLTGIASLGHIHSHLLVIIEAHFKVYTPSLSSIIFFERCPFHDSNKEWGR